MMTRLLMGPAKYVGSLQEMPVIGVWSGTVPASVK